MRAAAGEQVRSLGAKFLEVDLGGIKTEDAGGYAVELSEEAMARGRDLIAEHAKTADVVITTAQVPGRRAPLLVTEEAVNGMKRGAIIIDLAGSTGGNCALSKPIKQSNEMASRLSRRRILRQLCRSTPASSIPATSLHF